VEQQAKQKKGSPEWFVQKWLKLDRKREKHDRKMTKAVDQQDELERRYDALKGTTEPGLIQIAIARQRGY
jgi:hypothetical protein